ncbi:ATP-dependent zinc metalloprotease FtsH [Miltoncostaea marina]|uniref:ATP-dependent zinc metalloprotease FtsH n=1 Tax=Miltoncostaea marina TaxID=2843215 RepID=UPI001C3CDE01|nr:ATP-dependent zinc metalloprotease FtsH [Miltoncostaea marina]
MAGTPPEARDARPGRLLPWITVALVLLVGWGLVNRYAAAPPRAELDYPGFVAQVRAGNVESVTARGNGITGTLRRPAGGQGSEGSLRDFRTERPEFARDDLMALLQRERVAVDVEPAAEAGSPWLSFVSGLLPIVVIVLLIGWFLRRGPAAGMGSFGRARARRYEPTTERTTFADVAGIDEATEELREVVDFLREPDRYRRLGAAVPHGVLLYGPPGTGKTLLARAVAGEAGVPFVSLSASEFVEMFVGVGASRVRDLFAQAKETAPAIVFVDELDAVGRARGLGAAHGGSDEREQTLNQILAELDGFTGNEGVIVLAATNRPEILDPALLRAGRFDRRVSVNPPDRVGREAILRVHTRHHPLDADVDLAVLAASTPGMVGADLRMLANEAALVAGRRRSAMVSQRDFTEALEKVLLGAARRLVVSPQERERTAYHEAGHALLGMIQPGADPVRKISIVPRGRALGVTLQAPEADRYGYSADELRGRIVAMLGGRAAEELVYGQLTTGAEDDLEGATGLARRMVERWGMSEAVGPVSVPGGEEPAVQAAPAGRASERMRELVDAEVRRIIDDCHEDALVLLRDRRAALDSLAGALLEHETLDEAEAYRAAGIPHPPRRATTLTAESAASPIRGDPDDPRAGGARGSGGPADERDGGGAMELRDMVARTAWRAGSSEEEADRLVEAFLLELGRAALGGEVVHLGDLGTFRGAVFAPGRALAGATAPAGFGDVEGYDEGVAPRDS